MKQTKIVAEINLISVVLNVSPVKLVDNNYVLPGKFHTQIKLNVLYCIRLPLSNCFIFCQIIQAQFIVYFHETCEKNALPVLLPLNLSLQCITLPYVR